MKNFFYLFALVALGYGIAALVYSKTLSELSANNQELKTKLRYLENKYCFGFQELKAVAIPTSSVVHEGDVYQADLFLAAVPKDFIPKKILAQGRPVPVTDDGHGKVKFVASKPEVGNATMRKEWTGSIVFNHNGRDTSVTVVVPYTVLPRP